MEHTYQVPIKAFFRCLRKISAMTQQFISICFRLTCGTTWHSAAMMNSLRGNVTEGKLVDHTKHLVTSGELEAETGVSPGWLKHGGLSITKDEDRFNEFM